MIDAATLASCDPGIRHMVELVNSLGVTTSDSGDGSKFGHMEGALPFPHVIATVHRSVAFGMADTIRLALVDGFDDWHVDVTYSTRDGHCVLMVYKLDIEVGESK
jgi:hypothetical protein